MAISDHKKRRRLTVYPGQVSMIFNVSHAEEFYWAFKESVTNLPREKQPMVERFLRKMDSAIATGKRLIEKQSAHDRE